MTEQNDHILKTDFLIDVLYILRETFEGSPEGRASVYLDRGVGVFPTLESLSAGQVSDECRGTTIVAHAEHLKFYLDRLREFIEGKGKDVKWEQSWLIETVDEKEWDVLREGIRRSYESVLRSFAAVGNWDQTNIGEAIAIITHTAYHLGAIRQMTKSLRGEK